MKLGSILALLALILLAAPLAFADGGPVNMQFVNVNGVADGQYYVSPYSGTLNGQPVVLFCDDVLNEVNFGQTWTANVTNLGVAVATTNSQNNGFSLTRYGGVIDPNNKVGPANAVQSYEEAAWLVSQLATATDPTLMVNLQHGLWDAMNPGTYTDSGAILELDDAIAAYDAGKTPNLYSFEIVTNQNATLTGQVQEFIIETPKPGTLALMLSGVLALAASLIRVRRSA